MTADNTYKCYSSEELKKIYSDVSGDLIERYMLKLNAEGLLNSFLKDIGYASDESDDLFFNPDGRILVIGDSSVRKSDLEMTAGKLGYDKRRFEWVLDYKDAKKYPYKNLQYNYDYAAVLIGPVPHKCNLETDFRSVISALENEDGFPCTYRLERGTKLSITKENFTRGLNSLRAQGVIRV